MTEASGLHPSTLHDYIAILRRRWWIIVVLPLIAGTTAFVLARNQSPVYRATAQVLVNRSNIVSAITNISDPAVGDPTRFLTTEATIARSPVLAARVAAASQVAGVSGNDLLAASKVAPESNADILDVSVSWPMPDAAVRLANAYAKGFTDYKTALDTQRINDALDALRSRIKALQAAGSTTSPGYATLVQYQSQLETIGTLLANNTSVLKPADGAVDIRARPSRRAILGGLLGLVLGVGLALLVEALDRGVRAEPEIEGILGIPLLGRLPRPARHVRQRNALVMVANPAGGQAESFRKLKTSIEFLTLDRPARTIMITSPLPREGKSTTTANLAVAFARAGRRIVIVDLDLRRPALETFFYTVPGGGVTDVVAGAETLSAVVQAVPLVPGASPEARANGHGNGASAARIDTNGEATVHLVSAGTGAPASPEVLARILESERLRDMLEELGRTFDLVLIDTPPLLTAGDAIGLAASVDAVVLVVPVGVQRPHLAEVSRQLRNSNAPMLGFVLTGVGDGGAYGYGYSAYAAEIRERTAHGVERS